MTQINRITREDVTFFREAMEDADNGEGPSRNLLDNYQTIATKSAIYPGVGTPLGLMYVGLKINGECGEVAEHIGKAMRDDGFGQPVSVQDFHALFAADNLTPDRRTLIIKEIGDVLWYLSAACNELGTTLSEAAAQNLEKLCDRTERNALQGSGDTR